MSGPGSSATGAGTEGGNRCWTSSSVAFKQILCFLVDGTSLHLGYFDSLKKDPGSAATIETEAGAMLSSHSAKHFSKAFS